MALHKYGKDRRDGKVVPLQPFSAFIPFIMGDRDEVTDFYNFKMNVGEAERLLAQLRSEGLSDIGLMHVFYAAYVRMLSQVPQLNRFIAGQRVYARNDIIMVMVVKKDMKIDSPETTVKIKFDPRDTIYDVHRKVNEAVDRGRNTETDVEDITATLMKLPRFLVRLVVRCFFFLDYHDMLPKSILEASPFHGSMFFSNLGSLGIGTISHHLYNFGNVPVFVTMGEKKVQYEISREGKPIRKKYVELGCSVDEPICDGFTFAAAFRKLDYFLHHPFLLLQPPKEVKT